MRFVPSAMRWSQPRSRAQASDAASASGRASRALGRGEYAGNRASSASRASARESTRASARASSKESRAASLPNMYELAKPLLDGAAASGCSAAERQAVLGAIADLLDACPEASHYWAGPDTPLAAAVQSGCVDWIHLLLRAGASANERDSNGASVLHKAAFLGNTELCRILLEAQAELECRDREGQTPIFFAGGVDVCQLLVGSRADMTRVNRDGMSVLHLMALAGSEDVYAWLSSKMSRTVMDLRDKEGFTAVDYARKAGILVEAAPKRVVKQSVTRGSFFDHDDQAMSRSASREPLGEAKDAVSDKQPVGRVIRRKKVSANGEQRKSTKSNTAKTTPKRRVRKTTTSEGAPIKAVKDLYALTRPLMSGDEISDDERESVLNSIKDFLRRDPGSATSWRGPGSPLHSSVHAGCSDLVLVLLQAGADVNACGAQGARPLHLAAVQGNAEVCAVLLLARADVNALDEKGKTPMSVARDPRVRKLFTGSADFDSCGDDDHEKAQIALMEFVEKKNCSAAIQTVASLSTQASAPSSKHGKDKTNHSAWSTTNSGCRGLASDVTEQSEDEDQIWQVSRRPAGEPSQHSLSRASSRGPDPSGRVRTRSRGRADEQPARESSLTAVSRASSRGRESMDRSPDQGRGGTISKEPSEKARKRAIQKPAQPEETHADLFELARPMLDPTSNMAEQQQALLSVKQLLATRPESIKSWRGPDTPLHAAVKAGRSDFAALLFQAGVGANEQDVEGVSMLHHSAFDGNVDLCNAILAARADVDIPDCHGQTPLFFAPTSKICKILLTRRADLSTLNHAGQSSMHIAGLAGLREVYTFLNSLADGNLRDLRDLNGSTALDYARKSGISEPCEELNMATGSSSSSSAPVMSASGACPFGLSGSNLTGTRGRTKAGSAKALSTAISVASSRSNRSMPRCEISPVRSRSEDAERGLTSGLRSAARDELHHSSTSLAAPFTEARDPSATPSFGSVATRSPSHDRGREDADRRRSLQSDLYEVAKPLLDRAAKTAEQQRALSSVRSVLGSGLAAVAWHGPGTPLSAAVQAGSVDFAMLLMKAHADPHECTLEGRTMLHLASASSPGGAAMCRTLLSSRADIHARDREGQTPLFLAPSSAVCEALLEKRADIAFRDNAGCTALHSLAQAGLREAYLWLHARASEAQRGLKDSNGCTAGDYAERSNMVLGGRPSRGRTGNNPTGGVASTARAVSKRVSKNSAKRISAESRGKPVPDAAVPPGRHSPSPTPAEVARQRSLGGRQRCIQQASPDLYQLSRQAFDEASSVERQQRAWRSIQRSVTLDKSGLDSWSGPGTPLIGAVQADSQLFATVLLQARASVNTCDTSGQSPLHLAALRGGVGMCEVLLKARADINARDFRGQTPLFSAPSAEVCGLLVERRGDLAVLNEDGQSALHVAACAGLHQVFSLLSSKASKALCELDDPSGASALDYAEQAGIRVHDSVFSGSTRSSQGSSAFGAARLGLPHSPQRHSRQDGSSRQSAEEAGWHPAMSRLLKTHDQLLRELAER